jgi:hypothetical protein
MARASTRRTQGDPSIREAVVAKRLHLAQAFPSMADRAEEARTGELVLSTELLGGALSYAFHPRAHEFDFAADRHGERWWRIDAEDVLTELTSAGVGQSSGPGLPTKGGLP